MSDQATAAAQQVQTDPSSGFPDARPAAGTHPAEQQAAQQDAQQHHSAQQPRDGQGRFEGITQEELNRRIEAARAEEREKLHQRLEAERTRADETETVLRDQVTNLTDQFTQFQKDFMEKFQGGPQAPAQQPQGQEMQPADTLNPQIDEITRRFESQLQELHGTVQTVQQERDQERALREKQEELAALEEYRQQQVAAHQEDIAPQLRHLVRGFTREEIDASIQEVKQASQDIFTEVEQTFQERQQQGVASRAAMPTVGIGAPSSPQSPIDSTGQEQRPLTPQEIREMPMAEFARRRAEFGIRGGSGGRGMFG